MIYAETASGRVESVLVGLLDMDCTIEVPKIEVAAGSGVVGDRHSGGTRLADVREVQQRSTSPDLEVPVLNTRQFSAVSVEDGSEICAAMKLPFDIMPPGLQGENLVVSGIPDFTKLPMGTILKFCELKGGQATYRRATLLVWGENQPCSWPHKRIVEYCGKHYPRWEEGRRYNVAADYRRGIVGQIYGSGKIKPGYVISVWQPQ